MKVEGARRYVVRSNGQIWVLPQGIEEVLNWRRDQRRRKMLARWESTPPGPPGTEWKRPRGGEVERVRLWRLRDVLEGT